MYRDVNGTVNLWSMLMLLLLLLLMFSGSTERVTDAALMYWKSVWDQYINCCLD